jgi:hypothetical protein
MTNLPTGKQVSSGKEKKFIDDYKIIINTVMKRNENEWCNVCRYGKRNHIKNP